MNSSEGYKGFITFLILSGIVLTVLIGFRYINKPTSVETRASEPKSKATPKDVEIFEITESAAEIRWITTEKLAGEIIYGIDKDLCGYKKTKTCLITTERTISTAHYVILDDLDPGTTYYYKIKFDGEWFPADDSSSFTTKDAQKTIDVLNKPILKEIQEDEYDGFSDTVSNTIGDNAESGFYEPDSAGILGTQTNLLNELRALEFKEAVEYKDLNYDFNQDGEVDNLDYPLLIEFITNQED